MTPSRIEYDIGATRHGQPLRLIFTQTNGVREWTLCRDEGDQRDDRVFIAALSDHDILKMAECVKSQRAQA